MSQSTKRRSLALVVPGLALGGGVPAVARFVKDVALRDGRFDLQLISLSTTATDSESMRIASPTSWARGATTSTGVWEGYPFVQVGVMGGEFEFQRYRPRRTLTRLLSDCDLIQVVCGSSAWANAVIGLGKPVAMHVATRARVERRMRDESPHGVLGWWRKGMTEITDRMDDRALRRVEAIQVMNPWMLEYARILNPSRSADIRYAPPGVDANVFVPLIQREPVRDSYILCVGRFNDPRKNVGLLLEAYARLPKEVRNETRLVLAGSSGPLESFWEHAAALGLYERITYVPRPDPESLIRLYQGASLFALSSDEEGFGVVLLEAMSCGVPVVSTLSGGPEGIITDGKDGYLVPLDDAATLSERLSTLLLDPSLNIVMGENARKTIEERFDERVAGEIFIDIWERLMRVGRKLI